MTYDPKDKSSVAAGAQPGSSPRRASPSSGVDAEPSAKSGRSGTSTSSNAASSGASLLPSLSLPKGGGAIKGIGEKLTTNSATGTGGLSVPLAMSPGRSGFALSAALGYSSGAGNGPFGLGWSISTPAITRKTDKGLPHYSDLGDDHDVFILSGAEDLVPNHVPDSQGNPGGAATALDVLDSGDYRIQRYRPRVENSFSRIERWTHHITSDVHWRTITRDNLLSIFGQSAQARISDPDHPDRVFSWLLEETRDDRGNLARYSYKAEDGAGVDPGLASEANRFVRNPDGTRRFLTTADRYLKRIQYGNRTAVARDQPAPTAPTAWLFELVFDYGEHDPAAPTPTESVPWPVRPDPYSSYRSTFEVRCYRLCQRALMFHRFAELGPDPCLVRSTDFVYTPSRVRTADGSFDQGPLVSYLASITHAGYIRTSAAGSPPLYQRAAMPPLALDYAQPIIHDTLSALDRDVAASLPGAVRASTAQWVDLDGEGIPGVLESAERAWFYRANLGGGQLAPPALQRALPSGTELGVAQLTDLDADGNLDLVSYTPPLAGFFSRTPDADWAPFAPLRELPNIDWNDPNLRFVDLDGDGFPDVLITQDDAFVWYRSRAKRGFDPAIYVRQPRGEADGPAVVFDDPSGTETIQLADMSGDGLVDLVRVRNGEVCYWPNLGHGRFGRKVTLDHSPRFANPDQFTAARIRFGDVDGSGTSDIIYLGADGVRVYFNQSGNALTAPLAIRSLPPVDLLARLSVVDLLGQGTSCLVWTSPDPGAAPVAYVDLMAGEKPHLLTSVVDNRGGETRLTYASSTQFYLQDKAAGRPWFTRLAFPVHVIARIDHLDHIAGTTLTTRFAYHHGFYDGYEREFRGFARVEQWDAESFTGGFDVPPIRTVTWFHTGAWLDRERLEIALAAEYYQQDPQATLLPDTILPTGLSTREEREAARALRGQILRQEIYAEDGLPESVHPYSTSERSYQIRLIQHTADHHHASFFVHPAETVDRHYERNPNDPRTQHQLVLAVDDFGTVTQSASIGYPRRTPDEPEQGKLWALVSDTSVANQPTELDWYRVGVPISAQASELTGLAAPTTGILSSASVAAAIAAAAEIPFEATASGSAFQIRVVKRQRTLYYQDDLSTSLPLGQIDSLAIPYQSYQQAFTPGLVTAAYGSLVTDSLLTNEGFYVQQDGLWWAPSGRPIPDPTQFYLPTQSIDPFGQQYLVRYDNYSLLPIETQDPLGNRITVGVRDTTGTITQPGNDYRVLGPVLMTDPNRNRTAIAIDALGMVTATAVMGKDGAGEGDTLADPTTRLEYDLNRFVDSGGTEPVFVHTFAREQHGASNPRFQENYSYSDGSGREIMRKVQAEPGPVPVLDANGNIVRNPDGTPQTQQAASRWVGTGRTVFDNKGNPVKQYEPFFSATPDYETEQELVEWGVTPVLHYDPLGRLIRTDFPDGTAARVVFDAWTQESWDQNDTVAGSAWLARMQAGSTADQRAASLALQHAGTPTITKLDSLGRVFLTIADNGTAGRYQTRVALDCEGNQITITDARGNTVAVNTPDLLGRVIHAISADAGESRQLPDCGSKPVHEWLANGYVRHHLFDALQRPTHVYAQLAPAAEQLVVRAVYGEANPSAESLNLRGRLYEQYDGAGVAITQQCDFKGNPLSVARRLAIGYHSVPDWTPLASLSSTTDIDSAAASLLEAETFTTTAAYDALNRITSHTTPDASETRPTYNEANFLESLDVFIRGATTATNFIANIDYNARGQRIHIEHGNGTVCDYTYDPETFRLVDQRTTRTSDGLALQDLAYEYDPVGNVVQITDAVSYGNASVSATGFYEYDPIYQLISAQGREHPGQQPTDQDAALLALDHPNDLQALQRYEETYTYDPVGNIEQISHQPLGAGATGAGWTRNYNYATTSNRLLGTSLPGDAAGTFSATYSYDAAGNMITMPHLAALAWDHANQLQHTDLGGGGQVYFTYDGSGQRVRKAYEHGGFVEERIYLGGYELYRQKNLSSGAIAVERQTLQVHDAGRLAALVETKTIDTSVTSLTPTPRLRFQIANHLDSTATELDGTGAVISYEEYHPYGTTSWRAADSTVDVSARRYRYTGKEHDDETGLCYHGARYYAPWLGRWTSTDPAGFVDGHNLYLYVRNDPITLMDPSGLQSTAPVAPIPSPFVPPQAPTTALEAAAERWGVAELIEGGAGAGEALAPEVAATPVGWVIIAAAAILVAGAVVTHELLDFGNWLDGNPHVSRPARHDLPPGAGRGSYDTEPLPPLPPKPAPKPAPGPTPAPSPAPADPDEERREGKPEIYYRAMSQDEYKKTLSAGGLAFKTNGGEKFVTPSRRYAERLLDTKPKEYQVLVRFQLKAGSLADFIAHGRMNNPEASNDGTFSKMAKPPEGWTNKDIVLFKIEREALNIGFGPGSVHLFDSKVQEIKKLR